MRNALRFSIVVCVAALARAMQRTQLRRAIALVALASAFALAPTKADEQPPQSVSTESCLNCKHYRCLESLAAQREAIIAAYESISGSPAITVNDDSGKAVDQINTDTMPKSEVQPRLGEIRSKMMVYEQAVDRTMSRVPASECGPPVAETVAAETNPVTCVIDGAKLSSAMAAMPCKQLADMIHAHEVAHQRACIARKHAQGQVLPYIWLTPAGVAKEEADAYRAELALIQKMLDQLKQPQLVSEALSVERFPAPMGTIRETVIGTIALIVSDSTPQRVTGDGESVTEVDTSGSQCSVSGAQGTNKFSVTGQVTGGVLTLKATAFANPPPAIRVTCPHGFGFSLPSARTPSAIQIAYKDGETVTKTLVHVSQATVTQTLTLHLKCKEPKG
jgi:hypothetical protein